MRRIIFLLSVFFAVGTSCSRTIQSNCSFNTVINDSAVHLSVMSYNVHHYNPPCKAKDSLIDIKAIANAIWLQQPDLVALQEIDVNTNRSGKVNQIKEIAKQLNMHFYFGKAIDYDDGDYGVAILSKYPLSETIVNRLPTKTGTQGEPRILATAKVALPNKQFIRFGNTHLDVQRDSVNRILQMDEIIRIAAKETLPFIIAGDFNSKPGSRVIRILDEHFRRSCIQCPLTVPVVTPKATIDYIAFLPINKFEVVSHQVIQENYASDHLPVMAELIMKSNH